jgi:hypothetical protein
VVIPFDGRRSEAKDAGCLLTGPKSEQNGLPTEPSRGLVRGGRFVSGFGGDQFALPEVLDSLWATRNQELKGEMTIAGSDPVNLIGILIPRERTHAMPGRVFVIKIDMLEYPTSSVSRETKRLRDRENRRLETRAPAMLFDA